MVPGVPHHVTQRGNRRQPVFFRDGDEESYLGLMREFGQRYGLKFWAYCLMPNHVHLVVVPKREENLARGIGEAHRRYTRMVNLREGWGGYLWQGRFASYPMDERYAMLATRYIELNPVAAGLARYPEEYRWSSARAHVRGEDDNLLSKHPLIEDGEEWARFLRAKAEDSEVRIMRRHEHTGRPLGSPGFVEHLEWLLNRELRPQKRGRKRKEHGTKKAAPRN